MAFADSNNTAGTPRNDFLRYTLVIAGASAVTYLTFAENYLSIPLQFAIGWSLLVVVILLHRTSYFREVPWRFVFIFISAAISFRYLVWRTFETLIYTGILDVVGMTLLYLAELYALTIHFLGMFANMWPIRRKPAPLPDDKPSYPSVDILIPTYNEAESIVRTTVTAATQIDYPKDKLNIYLLDDGGTVARRNNPATSRAAWERHYLFRRLAGELGVHYITRETNSHAKSGNLNHALKQTGGELVAVLDCDHVPTRDFLQKTAGWFLKDRNLFLVQTPHFFINPTPVEKNLGDFANVPGENDMFYKVIHLGLDFWNSSYFCGSAAVLRRRCLEEVGGISGETITEDAETSFVLHSKGYNSVYIDQPMTCGLSPETFDDYIVQRTRWAEGMMQLFVLKNPITSKGLTLPQRICYFNSSFFWLFGLSRVIFYLAPAAFLILGLKVYNASIEQVIIYSLPHVISTFVVMDFLYGKARQPFFSEIYESVQSIFLLPAILSVILNPRKPVFKITPKGGKLDNESLNPLAGLFFMLILVNVLAVPLAVYKWVNYPLFRDVIIVTVGWSVFNIALAVASLGSFWEKRQVRGFHRTRGSGRVTVFSPDKNALLEGEVKDVSLTGMGFEIKGASPLKVGDEVVIEVSDSYGETYRFQARLQRHSEMEGRVLCGAEFASDRETYARLVRYVYGDNKRWADIWEARSQPKGTMRELLTFFRMGLKASKDSSVFLGKRALRLSARGFSLALNKAQNIYEKRLRTS